MGDAGLSPRQLAHRVGVSTKQVERWVGDADLTPHARNRADACRALGVDEEMLWPKAVQERVKTGGDREIVQSYPYRSACPSTVWAELVASARTDIFLAGYTGYFLWTQVPHFAETVRRKAESGCRVRFLVGDPDGTVTRQREEIEDVALTVSARIRTTLEQLTRLGPVAGVEARMSSPRDATSHVGLSVFRFDGEALVTPHLARLVGHDSPLLHLRRHGASGMFDRFAEHAEELWGRAEPWSPTAGD
ncbi:Transcriptional regulator [Streptomyces clavuligerus]|uniref:Transcriptional regulator n=3 Tax=Streptomyces clavuligerus TaxID=1901 RepID=E2PUL3_STRCL|nr:Transcriptional regulator [Streptomyces clavuligerus]